MADVALQPIVGKAATHWSLPHRLFFRFFAAYWLLYALPEGGRASPVPFSEVIFKPYEKMWHAIVPWVATHVFHVTGKPATYFPTGSGDTTLQYIENLLYVLISLAAMLVWSILDRRRTHYRALDAWLRILVRYTLAFTLFAYGFGKIFPLQFQPPRLGRLIEPYGEFSPMGVLWNFMGASLPFVMFTGCAETLGGVLLLFRRTTSLGAMVSFAVMLNVAVLNYCYDVPVKLYSTNLVFMAVFLLLPDLRRLADVLVLNRPAAPADLNPVRFERRWLRIAAGVCWVGVVGFHLVSNMVEGWQGYNMTYRNPQRPPHYGLYDVEAGAPAKWRKVVVQAPNNILVRTTDDTLQQYPTDKLSWSDPDPDHVVLQGSFDGVASTIRLRKIDTRKFLLLNRGFHWINETPFNK